MPVDERSKPMRMVSSTPPPNALTRRSVLQIAGSAAAATTIPEAMANTPPARQLPATRFSVNGVGHRLELDPRQSLLDVLRERLDLMGTKKGCNTGACGACTVLVDGRRIVSCLTLAAMHEGAEITTIEGIAKGDELHPLQAAFIKHDGLQCGYCTPGQIMSGVACISEGHASTPEEIQRWMSGNICRCGAYPGIVAAISETAKRG